MKLKNVLIVVKELLKKRKEYKDKGFTLTETLSVVAIIVILFAIVAINIIAYRRTLVQFKLDNTAKEIFVSAQNHLSMADGVNFLGRTDAGTEELDEDGKGTGVYYFVVDGKKEDQSNLDNPNGTNILNLMLPFGGIAEDVRTSNSYIVRYNKDAAIVMDVFYAETSGWFDHEFTKDEEKSLIDDYRGDEHKKDRRKYGSDESVIGYYGGESLDIKKENKYKAPKLVVVNDDTLYLEVTNTNFDVDLSYKTMLKVIITGETSGNKKEIVLVKDGTPEPDKNGVSYSLEDKKLKK